MVYGLTKGQASPTSRTGFTTPVQVGGVSNRPFNPVATALSLGAGFVSRASTGHADHALQCIKEAFLHPGYALVDIFQPCPSFNHVNTHKWFMENTYLLEDADHDPTDLGAAFAKAMEEERLPVGIFFRQTPVDTFEAHLWQGHDGKQPIWEQQHDRKVLQARFDSFR